MKLTEKKNTINSCFNKIEFICPSCQKSVDLSEKAEPSNVKHLKNGKNVSYKATVLCIVAAIVVFITELIIKDSMTGSSYGGGARSSIMHGNQLQDAAYVEGISTVLILILIIIGIINFVKTKNKKKAMSIRNNS